MGITLDRLSTVSNQEYVNDPRYIENFDRSRKSLYSSNGGYEKCGMVREVFMKS